MITTVAEFRAFDALGAYSAMSDAAVEAELEHAEEMLFGYVDMRGYDSAEIIASAAANVAVHRAIMKVARVELLSARGVNGADPAHALLIHERDMAVDWFRKSIASGNANLVGPDAPTRKTTGTAGGFSAEDDFEDRGW